ncbi:MAG: macro domain-containing protein [Candidatus Lokiarchaeota archaeon]|nr:macro domain-containing protein [Candidatus Lokiarchaeota archaeon]
MKEYRINNSTIRIVKDDITNQNTDAIVNAANSNLILGGGVAGAIRTKGGPSIQEQCNNVSPIKVGEAAITSAGKLKTRHVIHAVGPRMGEGNEDYKLKMATKNSLIIADQHSLKSIAFPAISTGIFGYPINRCAQIMINTVINYLKENTGIEIVVFCLFSDEDYKIFYDVLEQEG